MESNQFDVHVPDTIPAHITRRHERSARRTVGRTNRANPLPFQFGRRMAVAAGVIAALATIAGVVMTWVLWPSPFTFVVVPTAILVAAVVGGSFVLTRRFGEVR